MFKLTMHFKHEMIGIWQRFQRNFEFKWNFELTVFELTVPDLYRQHVNYILGDYMHWKVERNSPQKLMLLAQEATVPQDEIIQMLLTGFPLFRTDKIP